MHQFVRLAVVVAIVGGPVGARGSTLIAFKPSHSIRPTHASTVPYAPSVHDDGAANAAEPSVDEDCRGDEPR
jgi:hypothetical protein